MSNYNKKMILFRKNNIMQMLCLPDDVLIYILSYSDEKSIINLGKLSKRINKIIEEPRFWCSLLSKRNKYDDFTFCYQYNNDEVLYHKTCIDLNKIRNLTIPSLTGLSRDVNTLIKLWNIVRSFPTYYGFESYVKNINLDIIGANLYFLLANLDKCFEWSLHKINLYRTFSSSIFNFYKVLLSAFNWRESCRFNEKEICGNDTAIFSPFCRQCRGTKYISYLLHHVIDKTGSFYQHPFDKMKKRPYIKYHNIQFYLLIKEGFIIFLENDIIYCVGKYNKGTINEIVANDIPILDNLGLVYDDRQYDFVNYVDARSLDVNNFLIVDGKEIYLTKNHSLLVTPGEDGTIICFGKLEYNIVKSLNENEIILVFQIGMIYQHDNQTIELIDKINNMLQ